MIECGGPKWILNNIGGIMLSVGDKAPGFTLPNQDGESVSLNDFSGQKVLLWFFPKASTSGWTIEGQGFRDEFQKFK